MIEKDAEKQKNIEQENIPDEELSESGMAPLDFEKETSDSVEYPLDFEKEENTEEENDINNKYAPGSVLSKLDMDLLDFSEERDIEEEKDNFKDNYVPYLKLSESDRAFFDSLLNKNYTKVKNFIQGKVRAETRRLDLVFDITNKVFVMAMEKMKEKNTKDFRYRLKFFSIKAIGLVLKDQIDFCVINDRYIHNFYEKVKYVKEKSKGDFDDHDAKNIVRVDESLRAGYSVSTVNISDLASRTKVLDDGEDPINENEDSIVSSCVKPKGNVRSDVILNEFRTNARSAFAFCLDKWVSKSKNRNYLLIAKMYFYERLPKKEIAEQFQLSTSLISRKTIEWTYIIVRCMNHKLDWEYPLYPIEKFVSEEEL